MEMLKSVVNRIAACVEAELGHCCQVSPMRNLVEKEDYQKKLAMFDQSVVVLREVRDATETIYSSVMSRAQ